MVYLRGKWTLTNFYKKLVEQDVLSLIHDISLPWLSEIKRQPLSSDRVETAKVINQRLQRVRETKRVGAVKHAD